MKILLTLVLAATLVGCIGSPTPRNPMDAPEGISAVNSSSPWWRHSTVGVDPEDNPWEAFIHPNPLEYDWTDPWADFEDPQLFPDDWTPAEPEVDEPEEAAPQVLPNELDEV